MAEHYPMDSWVSSEGSFAGEASILVVDPATRKLCIPVSAVQHTQALMRMDRVPSICMLYLQGRCRQGMHCHQLHADPVVVDMLRAEVSMRTSCCPEHGEEVTQPSVPELNPELKHVVLDNHRIPAARVATTNGMRRMVVEASKDDAKREALTLQRAQVCRLHLQGRCRYAEDCNFVHLCRGLADGEPHSELGRLLTHIASTTPMKAGRPAPFMRPAGTPASAYVPAMPPSPLYAGTPQTPNTAPEHMGGLDVHADSSETTPPSTPSLVGRMTTPVGQAGSWRREPYAWQCVSPAKA